MMTLSKGALFAVCTLLFLVLVPQGSQGRQCQLFNLADCEVEKMLLDCGMRLEDIYEIMNNLDFPFMVGTIRDAKQNYLKTEPQSKDDKDEAAFPLSPHYENYLECLRKQNEQAGLLSKDDKGETASSLSPHLEHYFECLRKQHHQADDTREWNDSKKWYSYYLSPLLGLNPASRRRLADDTENSMLDSANRIPAKQQEDINKTIAEAVVFSVVGTSLVAVTIFIIYMKCRKKKAYIHHSIRDDRPLLSLTLSDFSGSSQNSFGVSNLSEKNRVGFMSPNAELPPLGDGSAELPPLPLPPGRLHQRLSNASMESASVHQRLSNASVHQRLSNAMMESPSVHQRLSNAMMESPSVHQRLSNAMMESPSVHQRLSNASIHQRLSNASIHQRLSNASIHQRLSNAMMEPPSAPTNGPAGIPTSSPLAPPPPPPPLSHRPPSPVVAPPVGGAAPSAPFPPPPPNTSSRAPPPPPPPNRNSSVPPPPLPPGKNSSGPPPPPSSGKNPGGAGPPPPPMKTNAPRPPPGNPNSKVPRPAPLAPNGMDSSSKTKLKPFFWDKVLANPDQSMVWSQLRGGSFQFDEEMIESLFGYAAANKPKVEGKESTAKSPQYVRILDAKKSQNLAISLKALNVKIDEVRHALMEGRFTFQHQTEAHYFRNYNISGNKLPVELIQTLIKMAPTSDEELRLRLYTGNYSELALAEQFLKALLDIPFAFQRLEVLLFMASLPEDISSSKQSFSTLEVACGELKNSRLFLKLLEAVLKTGNRMNDGTFRGGAQAFKLDTLLKLSDVKGTDGKTTLLHFVVQEIIRSEGVRAVRMARERSGSLSIVDLNDLSDDSLHESEDYFRKLGLKVVSGLGDELQNVKKAACLDSDALMSLVASLGLRLVKTKEFLNTSMKSLEEESGFHQMLKDFVEQAENEITFLLEEEKRIRSLVKITIDFFHGNTAKDEGLRLFVIVRDFLVILEKVCKEVREAPPQKKAKQPPPKNTEIPSSTPPVPDPKQRLFPAIMDRRVDSSSSDDSDDSDDDT
ncbi:hypothetical protein Cni_G19135 [Canna indica]|uniref:Formin-like protein n=1 Tax=Canna indica TaxID=4628 RepID=A0AAQ3QJG3_9LILI|nr:hypothetical protein Cni_G19135 [Canna indica]